MRNPFRGALRAACCATVLFSLTASTADAGLFPWLVDSLFGPVRSPYAAGYQYGGYQGRYECPTYTVPSTTYTQPVGAAPCYRAPYAGSCLPNPFPPILSTLFGGCRPCMSPYAGYGGSGGYGYRSGMGWGCSPVGYGRNLYGYGGCPITLPAPATGSATGSPGWKKSKVTPKTFADPQASGEDKVDTKTFRPPVAADPGQVIPQVKRAVTKPAEKSEKKPVEKPAEKTEKKPAEKSGTKPADGKTSMAPGGVESAIAWRVIPSRARLARRGHRVRLGDVVVARQVIRVRPGGSLPLPGVSIVGR